VSFTIEGIINECTDGDYEPRYGIIDTPLDVNININFGFYDLWIGNYVWYNTNSTGVQDAHENGIPGLKLRDVLINDQGYYVFSNLKSLLSIQSLPWLSFWILEYRF